MNKLRSWVFACMTLMLACPAVMAQDDSAQENASLQEQLDAHLQETEKVFAKFREKMTSAQTELKDEGDEAIAKKMGELQEAMFNDMRPIYTKILEIGAMAEKDPKVSMDALKEVLSTPMTDLQEKAIPLLVQHHADNPEVLEALQSLGLPSQIGHDAFGKIIENSSIDTIRAEASIARIAFISSAKDFSEILEANPQIMDLYPATAKYVKSLKDFTEDDMLALYRKAATDFGDVEVNGEKVSELVAGQMKMLEIRSRVAIGKVAPDIEGPDIDGEKFKLSDYRGKVVMLDFWGDW